MRDLPNLANFDYVDRVNRAVDYVTHDLGDRCRWRTCAGGLFLALPLPPDLSCPDGGDAGAFVKRVRLERAVYLLSHRREREPDRDRAGLRVLVELQFLPFLSRATTAWRRANSTSKVSGARGGS